MNSETSSPSKEYLPYEKEVNVVGRYILTHPFWRRAFPNHEVADVVNTILRHLKRKTIRIAQNEDNEIIGILMYTPNPGEQFIQVDHLIGSDQRIIDAALAAWQEVYPGFSVSMKRRGKDRFYHYNQFFGA